MANKKPAFNMAEEIRTLLEADKTLTGKQVFEALRKKFPRQKINENSLINAYSTARRKLGIVGKKRKVVRKKPSVSNSAPAVDFDALRAAKHFLAACDGDSSVAIAALKQLSSLQMS